MLPRGSVKNSSLRWQNYRVSDKVSSDAKSRAFPDRRDLVKSMKIFNATVHRGIALSMTARHNMHMDPKTILAERNIGRRDK